MVIVGSNAGLRKVPRLGSGLGLRSVVKSTGWEWICGAHGRNRIDLIHLNRL